MEVKEIIISTEHSLVPAGSEHAEEVLIPEKSIPSPYIHKEVAGNTECVEVKECPSAVQEGSDVNTMNVSANIQSQLEETYVARLSAQGGNEMVQLPFTQSNDMSVQEEAMDPPINNEVVLIGVLPIAINIEVGNLKPFVHFSETLGTLIYGNSVLRSVLLFLIQMT